MVRNGSGHLLAYSDQGDFIHPCICVRLFVCYTDSHLFNYYSIR